MPIANDDAFSFSEDYTEFGLPSIFGELFADNGFGEDFDTEGDSFVITHIDGTLLVPDPLTNVATIPLHGIVDVSVAVGTGDFALFFGDDYDWLPAGWTTTESFTYTIRDSGGDTATATATFTITGIDSNDRFDGTSGADVYFGGIGNDVMLGNAGADTLTGGRGKDRLEGGADADIFDFDHKLDSKKGGQRDVIADFERGLDHIDLSTIDAVKGAGDQAFKWIGKKDFTGTAGELHFVKKGGGLIVEGDIDGNGKADFQIQLLDLAGIGNGDFIL